ncbi:saccharopine dehydrogenase family protein [Sporosarcina trichiuri]|uniref:saccharopine dehydrogenase family protein n=1 Tax=Sporosarcina trichiuri TaxID=3056445 RepID=UPI0025B4D9C1|nr:saccharopine dehydrogenase C-terminal domain-containing protein [Sporosarcina sp. 0.2-SM1T-5]WJY28122.1 saccharopine dehydrogenase C-terminal domain-containing protein [Sporosarcina sp. 0.2-SM1T-5]
MHAVVLGTGRIGTTVVRELAKFSAITTVTAVDGSQHMVDRCLEKADNPKVIGRTASLSSVGDLVDILEDADVAVGCLPHSLSLTAVRAAIASRCHLVDLVGSLFQEKLELDSEAREAGVTIVPGCGVAPGITNFLAAQGIELLDSADHAVMICGGIPRMPLPPLWYQVVFRLESVLGLYTKPAAAIRNDRIVEFPALSELESITFPYPVGACEAVITDAHSTAYTLLGKVKNLTEKTVRYPGHWSKMKVLAELGFLEDRPIEVEGIQTTPRKVSEQILAPQMVGESNEDVTVVRVEVFGMKDGRQTTHKWELVDNYDHQRGITSMAKTTALPAVIAAKWLAENRIPEKGVMPIESIAVRDRFDPFLDELKNLGITIDYQQSV